MSAPLLWELLSCGNVATARLGSCWCRAASRSLHKKQPAYLEAIIDKVIRQGHTKDAGNQISISSQHTRLPESQGPQACRTFRLHVVCAVGQTSAAQQLCPGMELCWDRIVNNPTRTRS
jgi:hypothetical protein